MHSRRLARSSICKNCRVNDAVPFRRPRLRPGYQLRCMLVYRMEIRLVLAMVPPLLDRRIRRSHKMTHPVIVASGAVVRVVFDILNNSNRPMWLTKMYHDHLSNADADNYRFASDRELVVAINLDQAMGDHPRRI